MGEAEFEAVALRESGASVDDMDAGHRGESGNFG